MINPDFAFNAIEIFLFFIFQRLIFLMFYQLWSSSLCFGAPINGFEKFDRRPICIYIYIHIYIIYIYVYIYILYIYIYIHFGLLSSAIWKTRCYRFCHVSFFTAMACFIFFAAHNNRQSILYHT